MRAAAAAHPARDLRRGARLDDARVGGSGDRRLGVASERPRREGGDGGEGNEGSEVSEGSESDASH